MRRTQRQVDESNDTDGARRRCRAQLLKNVAAYCQMSFMAKEEGWDDTMGKRLLAASRSTWRGRLGEAAQARASVAGLRYLYLHRVQVLTKASREAAV